MAPSLKNIPREVVTRCVVTCDPGSVDRVWQQLVELVVLQPGAWVARRAGGRGHRYDGQQDQPQHRRDHQERDKDPLPVPGLLRQRHQLLRSKAVLE